MSIRKKAIIGVIIFGLVMIVVWFSSAPSYVDPDENLIPAAPMGTTQPLPTPAGFAIPDDVNLTDTDVEMQRVYPSLNVALTTIGKNNLIAQLKKRYIYRPISDDVVEDGSYKVEPIVFEQNNVYPSQLNVALNTNILLFNQNGVACNLTSTPQLGRVVIGSQQGYTFVVSERAEYALSCDNGLHVAKVLVN